MIPELWIDEYPFSKMYFRFSNKYIADFLLQYREDVLNTDVDNTNTNELIIDIDNTNVKIIRSMMFCPTSNSLEEALIDCLFNDFDEIQVDDQIIDEYKKEFLMLIGKDHVRKAYSNFIEIDKRFVPACEIVSEIGELCGGEEKRYNINRQIICAEVLNDQEISVCNINRGVLKYFKDPYCDDDEDTLYVITNKYEDCKYGDYCLPDYVVEVGKDAFECSAEEIILPLKIKRIGANAFSGCKLLRKIHIPEATIIIDDTAFDGIKDKITIVAAENSFAAKYANANAICLENEDTCKIK